MIPTKLENLHVCNVLNRETCSDLKIDNTMPNCKIHQSNYFQIVHVQLKSGHLFLSYRANRHTQHAGRDRQTDRHKDRRADRQKLLIHTF